MTKLRRTHRCQVTQTCQLRQTASVTASYGRWKLQLSNIRIHEINTTLLRPPEDNVLYSEAKLRTMVFRTFAIQQHEASW